MDLPPSLPLVRIYCTCLSKNKRLLLKSSKEFQNIVLSLKKGTYLGTLKDEAKYISFVMKQAAELVHHGKYRYNINKTMHQEIDSMRSIAHIIPRMPMAMAFGNSCLESVGGYSISLLDSGGTYHSRIK
jgi:hypothetical protein